MTMPDLAQLSEVLEHEARQLDVSPAPTAALVAHGRGVVRRRHLLAGAAVLALALVAGVALVLVRPDPAQPARQPNTVADLAAGVRPKVPYLDTLDIVTTDGRHRRVFNRPPLMLGPDVVVVSGDGTPGIEYSRFDGTANGALNGAAGEFLTGSAVVSPDGHWAAAPVWRSTSPVRVAVFDLRREVRAGVATFDTPSRGFELVGVDNRAGVYGAGAGRSWRWDRGTGVTTALRGVHGGVVSVRGDGRVVVASGRGTATRTTLGSLDASYRFWPESAVTGDHTTWSPDHALLAGSPDDRTVTVRDGKDVRLLGLPHDVTVHGLVWEDEDDLLVWVLEGGNRGSLLRCRTSDGGCEIALTPFGPDAALPHRP
jgi:hypothetical protein